MTGVSGEEPEGLNGTIEKEEISIAEVTTTNVLLHRSIVYGSIATPIKKPESDHTHKWTIYVKGAHNEDIGTYIKRVSFKLHESFPVPTRNMDEAPFEVTETGWGEFQVHIRIVFQDANQKPINLSHHLKLYPTEEVGQLKTSRPVISEHYEEIVFEPPTDNLASILVKDPQYFDLKTSPRYDEYKQMEDTEIESLDSAIKMVRAQLEEVNTKISQFTPSDPSVSVVANANVKKSRPKK